MDERVNSTDHPFTSNKKSLSFAGTLELHAGSAIRLALLGRLIRVDLIKWVSNVRLPIHSSIHPQKVF